MGIFIACSIIALLAAHLAWVLTQVTVDPRSVMTYLHIFIQAYLYTGLFITAHDSMHGSVTRNRKFNDAIGQLALWLFAAFRYRPMFLRHMAHHRNPGSEDDPDFCTTTQNPIRWFFHFFFTYVTVIQLVTMALLFNIARYLAHIPVGNLILFWVVPAFMGTIQLFYFGTYRPHRLPHTEMMAPHRSRTQRKHHLWAMLSCYFFGYHWEHHQSPLTPWWRLYQSKH